MGVYNQLPVAVQEPIELLCLEDEIVNSAFWSHRQRPDACEELSVLMVIADWKAGKTDPGTAIGLLMGLVDPADHMLGIAAVMAARAK